MEWGSFYTLFDATEGSTIMINSIAAIAIVLIGFIVGKIVSSLLKRVLNDLELNKVLKEQAGVKIPVEETIAAIAQYLIYFIAVILALNQLGLQTVVLQILLFIVLALMVSFVILALKDFIPNIVAGFFIHQKDVLKKGNIIVVKGIEGKVIEVKLVETKLKTADGDVVFIPNSVLTKNEVIKKKVKR